MKKSIRQVVGRRIASVIMSAVLAFTGVGLLPQASMSVQAAEQITSYTINDASVDLSINESTTIQINGNGSATNNTISLDVASGKTVTVKLNNVNIDVSSNYATSAFRINGAGNVIIELNDSNTLISGRCCAGIQKESNGTLTISGNGSLTATGGECGAGIGGGDNGNGSEITISGGTVTAIGGEHGAGIGGGDHGNGSEIKISGGTVTANGGMVGAGIGGGLDGNGSEITISGGTVTANGGIDGAGIGGGDNGNGSEITISGGTVTATGGNGGAGIGGGFVADGSNIVITGGTVTAAGGIYGAGIGGGGSAGGSDGNGTNISISGGTVYAIGGDTGAGIGGGLANGPGGTASGITISGSSVVSVSGGGDYNPPNSSAHDGAGSSIGTGGHDNEVSGDETTPDTSGLYTSGCVKYYPAGTGASDITTGTVQPSETITGSVPEPQIPTVINDSEPEPPINWMQEVEDKISEAIALGGTRVVRIEGYSALSYHVLEMLKENPDITLVSEFTFDGLDYRITIPGSAVELDPTINWYGPKYLFPKFYMYGSDTLPSVKAFIEKYGNSAS